MSIGATGEGGGGANSVKTGRGEGSGGGGTLRSADGDPVNHQVAEKPSEESEHKQP